MADVEVLISVGSETSAKEEAGTSMAVLASSALAVLAMALRYSHNFASEFGCERSAKSLASARIRASSSGGTNSA